MAGIGRSVPCLLRRLERRFLPSYDDGMEGFIRVLIPDDKGGPPPGKRAMTKADHERLEAKLGRPLIWIPDVDDRPEPEELEG